MKKYEVIVHTTCGTWRYPVLRAYDETTAIEIALDDVHCKYEVRPESILSVEVADSTIAIH